MNNRLWNIFIDRKRKLKIEKQIVVQIVYSKPPIHFYPITVMQWHGKRERCTQTRQWTHYVFKNSKNKLRTELKLTVACVISMMSSVGGCVSEVFECNIIWCSNRSQTWTNPKWVSYGGDRTSSWAPRVFLKEHSLSHFHCTESSHTNQVTGRQGGEGYHTSFAACGGVMVSKIMTEIYLDFFMCTNLRFHLSLIWAQCSILKCVNIWKTQKKPY